MDPLLPGDPRRIGDYRLEGRLGAGGMGQVYLGLSPGGRRVAVKVIRPDHAGTPHFRERFAREIEAARRVHGFYTAEVVDADPAGEPPWMATAYIPGRSLDRAVRDDGAMSAERVRALGAALAEGLAAIHRSGIVHRDLKPANIVLAETGEPRIIDFGIARARDAGTFTAHGAVLGSWAYMSPEHVGEGEITEASDIFSLGSVLVFAATGRSPFDAPAVPLITRRILAADPDLDAVPGPLREVIAECLAAHPGDRPTAQRLLTRLTGLEAATRPDPPEAPGGWAPPPQPRTVTGPDRPTRPSPARRLTRAVLQSRTGRWSIAVVLVATLAAAVIPTVWERPLHTIDLDDGAGPMQFGPDGRLHIIDGRQIVIWNPRTKKRSTVKLPAGIWANRLAVSRDDKAIAAAITAGIYLWRRQKPGEAFRPTVLQRPIERSPTLPTLRERTPVHTVVFTPDGKTMASDWGKDIRLWDVATGHVRTTLKSHKSTVMSLSYSGDGKILASADAEGAVLLWDPATGRSTALVRRAPEARVALSPDGRTLAISDRDTVAWWDVATRRSRYTLSRRGYPADMAFSPDSRVVAFARGTDLPKQNGSLEVWDTRKNANLRKTTSDVRQDWSVAISADGRYLAAGIGGKVKIWKMPKPDDDHR
ncbi:WD40 repeat domain-containing serine/threonine protein kinase [Actinomadura macrotermitis]|uniref:Serine/threonine-protein kinase PknD n=1 Tax=Actinomadura macrotermitis TaxID=2585200 RepID=A0A7K0C8Z2_9ACTN|nr:serine/threonine-protein kinase [Actinomadura macrotermitis]MQY09264.1 Serine/threonine-protein kinase PknD [Actinomadura macrotermitis]